MCLDFKTLNTFNHIYLDMAYIYDPLCLLFILVSCLHMQELTDRSGTEQSSCVFAHDKQSGCVIRDGKLVLNVAYLT